MSSYQDFKSFYQSNILLFIILLFVVVYIIINWSFMWEGNYFSGEFIKPILITGIIFLISHMLITWDDNSSDSDTDDLIIPKYKFQNNLNNDSIKNNVIQPDINIPNLTNINSNPIDNGEMKNQIFSKSSVPIIPNLTNDYNFEPQNIPKTQSLNNKYKIVNKYNVANSLNSLNNSSIRSKNSNRNIFISHKNSSKYGLKF